MKKNLEIEANKQLLKECKQFGFRIIETKPKREKMLKKGLVLSINRELVQLLQLIEINSNNQELWEVFNITSREKSFEWI